MRRSELSDIFCSLGRSLDVVDSWSLLILRDVYLGVDTFDDLVRDLDVSRAVLSGRLDSLVERGVLTTQQYQERPARHRYVLTESGREFVPIMIALMRWGDKWRSPGGPPMLMQHACGEFVQVDVTCAHCNEDITSDTLTPRPGPGSDLAPGTQVVTERLLSAEMARTAEQN